MPTTYLKDPEDVLDYSFDWTDWLEAGETIASYVVTAATGITKDADAEVSGVVTVWLSGGTALTGYRVECKITTSEGRAVERSITVRVAER